MPQLIGLTQRDSLVLGSLQKHLSEQLAHNQMRTLPDVIDENTGEVLKSGSKALKVNEKFGEYFNEAFQNALKKAGKYVTVKDSKNCTWNVIAFKPSVDISADESKFGVPGKLQAQVILVQESFIADLDINIPVENEIRVQM